MSSEKERKMDFSRAQLTSHHLLIVCCYNLPMHNLFWSKAAHKNLSLVLLSDDNEVKFSITGTVHLRGEDKEKSLRRGPLVLEGLDFHQNA